MSMNLIMSLFFCLVSGAYLFFATAYSFGSLNDPRAGFLPTVVGVVGIIFSLGNFLVVAIEEIRKSRAAGLKITLNIMFIEKALFVIIAMMAYVFLIPLTGYLVASFILLFFLMKIVGVPNWIKPMLLSSIFAGVFFLLFVVLLGVPLPYPFFW